MPWNNSVAITFDHTQVPSTQTNFPVVFTGYYPQLAAAAYGGSVVSDFGLDILFAADAAGNSPLLFERAAWQPRTGACEFWIQIPSLSSTADTTIYILFGNPDITTDLSSTNAVWGSDFWGVYHNAFTFDDSTSNQHNMLDGNGIDLPSSPTGGYALPVLAASFIGPGAIASSAVLGQNPQGLSLGAASFTSFTASGWVQLANLSGGGGNFYLFGGNIGLILGLFSSGSGAPFAFFASNYGNATQGIFQDLLEGPANLATRIWYHIATTLDASLNASLYVNGALAGSKTFSSAPYNNGDFGLPSYLLAYCGASNGDSFLVDEVHISTVARSAGWIAAEYASQVSPATFYSTSLLANNPPNPWGPFTSATGVLGLRGPAVGLWQRPAITGAIAQLSEPGVSASVRPPFIPPARLTPGPNVSTPWLRLAAPQQIAGLRPNRQPVGSPQHSAPASNIHHAPAAGSLWSAPHTALQQPMKAAAAAAPNPPAHQIVKSTSAAASPVAASAAAGNDGYTG